MFQRPDICCNGSPPTLPSCNFFVVRAIGGPFLQPRRASSPPPTGSHDGLRGCPPGADREESSAPSRTGAAPGKPRRNGWQARFMCGCSQRSDQRLPPPWHSRGADLRQSTLKSPVITCQGSQLQPGCAFHAVLGLATSVDLLARSPACRRCARLTMPSSRIGSKTGSSGRPGTP
jgi:hypothetical protein